MKPIKQNENLQTLTEDNVNKFNGNYDIVSIDSDYRTTAFALTFYDKFDALGNKDWPSPMDRINLFAIDGKHIKVTLYRDSKIVRTKIIKGHFTENYFEFKFSKVSSIRPFYFILNGYVQQKNKIGILKNGDLILDTKGGGSLYIVFLPLFGSSFELQGLVYKRRNGN